MATKLYILDLKEEEVEKLFKSFESFIQHPSSSNHFISKNSAWVIYIERAKSDFFNSKVKICILDWSKKSRPKVSIEEFLKLADFKTAKPIIFNLDLFSNEM